MASKESSPVLRGLGGGNASRLLGGLAEVQRALDEGRQPEPALDLKKRFNAIKGAQFPWVYEVTKCAVEGAFRNLGAALANFRQSKRGGRKGRKVRFPHFKSKRKGFKFSRDALMS